MTANLLTADEALAKMDTIIKAGAPAKRTEYLVCENCGFCRCEMLRTCNGVKITESAWRAKTEADYIATWGATPTEASRISKAHRQSETAGTWFAPSGMEGKWSK